MQAFNFFFKFLAEEICQQHLKIALPETPRSLLKTSLTTTGFNLINFGNAAITSD